MNLGDNALLTSLMVFKTEYTRANHLVPGRDFHSLTYRYSGKKTVETKDRTVISCADSITYIPKGIGYRSQTLEAGEIIAVHFTLSDEESCYLPEVLDAGEKYPFGSRFEKLFEHYRTGQVRDFKCFSLFYEILDALTSHPDKDIINEARDYIDTHFSDPMLSICELAYKTGVSESYFRRQFKAYFNISPMAYLKNNRITHAKTLLRSGYYKTSEVARMCGFSSESYFSTEFRRITGKSPSEYRY